MWRLWQRLGVLQDGEGEERCSGEGVVWEGEVLRSRVKFGKHLLGETVLETVQILCSLI